MADQKSAKPTTDSSTPSTTNPSIPIEKASVSHALSSLEDSDKSTSIDPQSEHQLGDISSMIEQADEDAGDFALLDEAIAELESDKSVIDPNIPTLSDIVEPSSHIATATDEAYTEAELGVVPTLNHVATEVATPESAQISEPSAINSTPASQAETLDTVVDSAQMSASTSKSRTEQNAANATLEFNHTDKPPEEEMFTASELILAEEEDPLSTYSRPVPAAEHYVNLDAENTAGLSISIPYSLHNQLSKKIDNLVIEATTSMTNELHHQLTLRLNGLVAKSVESVLPKLIDQMVTSLRDEVNGQVKHELPSIINEVLGKTNIPKD